MSVGSWLQNARGEWYVIGQTALMLLVLLGPMLEPGSTDRGMSLSGADIAGGLLCIAGLVFVALGSVALGRNSLSAFPKPRDSANLVESGVFSVVRHPIYTGLSLCAFGWSLLHGSVLSLICTLALVAFFDIKARREERWLAVKFDGYAAYRQRVRKLIPFIY